MSAGADTIFSLHLLKTHTLSRYSSPCLPTMEGLHAVNMQELEHGAVCAVGSAGRVWLMRALSVQVHHDAADDCGGHHSSHHRLQDRRRRQGHYSTAQLWGAPQVSTSYGVNTIQDRWTLVFLQHVAVSEKRHDVCLVLVQSHVASLSAGISAATTTIVFEKETTVCSKRDFERPPMNYCFPFDWIRRRSSLIKNCNGACLQRLQQNRYLNVSMQIPHYSYSHIIMTRILRVMIFDFLRNNCWTSPSCPLYMMPSSNRLRNNIRDYSNPELHSAQGELASENHRIAFFSLHIAIVLTIIMGTAPSYCAHHCLSTSNAPANTAAGPQP